MALEVKVGNFALDQSTGEQAITGVGFEPKIVIFQPSTGTADGVRADAHMSWGAAVSSTERFAIDSASEDAQGTMDTSNISSVDVCIIKMSTGSGSTRDYEADFVSMDADGFTIDIENAPDAAVRIGYMALGGAAITDVHVGFVTAQGSTGDQAVAGLGFKPDFLMCGYTLDAGNDYGAYDNAHSIGFASAAGEQGVTSTWDDNGLGTSDASRYQNSGTYCAISPYQGAYAFTALKTFDADGFTLTHSIQAVSYDIHYLAIAGPEFHVGDVTTQTSTGTWAESGVGFTPVAGMFSSFCHPASATDENHLVQSLGMASGAAARFSTGQQSEYNVATSDTDSWQNDGLIYSSYDQNQGLLGSVDLSSWDADGFTLDQIDADPTAGNQLLYWLVGEAGGPTYTLTSAQGSCTYTGQTVGLLAGRLLALAQGVYTYTGQAIAMVFTRLLAAVQGTYTYTGQTIAFKIARLLAMAQGTYTYTGQATGVLRSRLMAAAQGAYTYTGQTIGMTFTRLVAAAQGSYTYTGQTTSLLAGRLLALAQGAYTYTGQTVGMTYTRVLTAVQGAYTYAGQALNRLLHRTATPLTRIMNVPFLSRSRTVPDEDRTMVMPADTRSTTIRKEDRPLTVPDEDRTYTQ